MSTIKSMLIVMITSLTLEALEARTQSSRRGQQILVRSIIRKNKDRCTMMANHSMTIMDLEAHTTIKAVQEETQENLEMFTQAITAITVVNLMKNGFIKSNMK